MIRRVGCWLILFLLSGWVVSGCAPIIPSEVNVMQPAPTRSSIVLAAPPATTSSPITPVPSPTPSLTPSSLSPGLSPTEPELTRLPAMPTQQIAEQPAAAQPAALTTSWKKPWQYYSATLTAGGPILYRLRYPQGWYAYTQPGGAGTLQNFPAGRSADGHLEPGMIRIDITASVAEKTGGLPAPNTRILAAGRPGTRQVLLDSSLGMTIWSARLYGLVENSAALNLVGWLNLTTPETEEGIRLLDTILSTLEVYSWTDPAPPPAPLDGSNSDSWEVYSGTLETDSNSYSLSFRYPPGWWLDTNSSQRIDLSNYVIIGAADGPLQPGAVRLSISAAACKEAGGCPAYPRYLLNGLPGTRETAQSPDGETSWLVRIFRGDTQILLYANMAGSPHQVAEQIQVLDMLLRTFQLK